MSNAQLRNGIPGTIIEPATGYTKERAEKIAAELQEIETQGWIWQAVEYGDGKTYLVEAQEPDGYVIGYW